MSGLKPGRAEVEDCDYEDSEKERAVDAWSIQEVCSGNEEDEIDGRGVRSACLSGFRAGKAIS